MTSLILIALFFPTAWIVIFAMTVLIIPRRFFAPRRLNHSAGIAGYVAGYVATHLTVIFALTLLFLSLINKWTL